MAGCNTGIGTIEVKAPNGKPSGLFDALLEFHRGNLDAAYRDYLSAELKQVELADAPRDQNGEPTLDSVLQAIAPANLSKPLSAFLTDSLKQAEQYIREPEVNASGEQGSFYKMMDKAGNVVKDLIRTSNKIREFAYGKEALEGKDKDVTTWMAERNANDAFNKVGASPASGTVSKEGVEYTYKEYVEMEKKLMTKGATKGTLIHLKIQEFLARAYGDKITSAALKAKMADMHQAEGIPSDRFDWVTDQNSGVWDHIAEVCGIRDKGENQTKVYSELRVGDADLGMASTIDMTVEDPLTGKIRVVDFKTGNKFLDSSTSRTMVYGRELTPVYNTKKNRARLQVVLNMVAIKAANPQAQFEAPLIVWLPNQEIGAAGKNVYDVDVRDYLSMVENHYRNEYPEAYAKLLAKSPDIFNANHYGAAVNSSFAQDLINDKTGLRDDEHLDKLKLELERLELAIRLRPDGTTSADPDSITPAEKAKREELLMKILQAQTSFALPSSINSIHEQEIGLLTKWFGVLSDTNNPYLQSYSQALSKSNAEFHAERIKIDQEFNVLLQKAVTKVFGNVSLAEKAVSKIDKSKLWDQLVDKKLVKDENDVSRLNIGMKTETSPGYQALPQELKDLSKFMRTNMKDVFEHVMVNGPSAVIEKKVTGSRTKLDFYNNSHKSSFAYDETFIPKMGITREEVFDSFKKQGLVQGTKDLANYWWTKNMTEWFETNVEGDNQQDYGIPVKYVGTTNSITAVDTHSMDLERSFKKYMEAMLTKKHYDNTFALGMSLSGLLRSNQNATKSADFLEHAVFRGILKKGSISEDKLWTHGFRIGKYKGQDVQLSTRKVLQGMNRGVASVGLWLNIPSMVGNAVQAEWAVAKEALLYGVLDEKWGNVSPEDKDLTFTNFNKAKLKVAKMQSDFLQGKGKSNAIHVFMKEFDLYPEIAKDHYDQITGGNKAFSLDHLTAGYQHAEDMTTANLMVTALMTMKIKSGKYQGKSMWDMYENSLVLDKKTGLGHFELPSDFSRGKVRMGDGSLEGLSGLHYLEIQRLKTMARKLKGGYRKEERSMIEASYLGESFMLFRRWLPNALATTWKSKHRDITVGSFKVLEQQNGEDIHEWKARVVEGRLATMFNLFGSVIGLNNSHKWGDLSSEQKKNVLDVGMSFITWAGIAILIGGIFGGDDDKEKKKYLLALDARLAEHISPMSLAQLLDQPAAAKSVVNVLTAVSQLATGGATYAMTGDESDLRTEKGDIRGLKKLERNVPFGAALRGAETYIGD